MIFLPTLRILGLAALGVISSGCLDQKKEADSKGEKLVLATSADQAPFEFHLTAQGKDQIVGFDIDVAQALAKRLKRDLEVKDMDFNGIVSALVSKRADMAMASLNVTPEREKNVDFSIPYLSINYAVISKKEAPLKSVSDFKGKKIGAQLGSTTEQYGKTLVKQDPTINLASRNKLGDLIQEIKAGRLAGGLMDETAALEFAKKNQDLSVSVLPADANNSIAIAFPKGSPLVAPVNDHLKEMAKNGELEALRKKWFS